MATGSAGLDSNALPENCRKYQIIQIGDEKVRIYRRRFHKTKNYLEGKGRWVPDNLPENMKSYFEFEFKTLAKKRTRDIVNYQENITATSLEIPVSYSKWINGHCRYMELKELMATGKAIQVDLPEVFIPLYTNQLKNENRTNKASPDIQKEQQNTVDIEELIVSNDYMLIEGQAGSGKTTLQKHVAYNIINQKFGRGLDDYLPILIFFSLVR